jgi:hypothetical protein
MMKFRLVLALLALTLAALESDARPPRRGYQPSYSYPTYSSPTYSSPTYQYPTYSQPAYQYPTYQQPFTPASYAQPVGEYTSGYTPVVTAGYTGAGFDASTMGGDGLDEVNAKRAARGLRPFLRDPSLTQAAQACAQYRAQYGLFGHTSNDFGFLPPGTSAASAGCAAYPASYGWMSCCTYDNYTYAGAAAVTGRDGRRYMHLFVR